MAEGKGKRISKRGDGMTREEKISHLKGILSEINENDNAVCYLTSEDSELIESAIEALERESQTFEWCTDCREYDQEKHCCHRWSKVIRNTVEDIKQEQEPCDKCEVGNPCLYCKHEFEPQESEKS